MTAYSKTINNSIQAFGIGRTSQWGSMVWGSGKWGEGSIPVDYLKFINVGIANSLASDSLLIKRVAHIFSNTQASTSEVAKTPIKPIANAIASDSALNGRDIGKDISNNQLVNTSYNKDSAHTIGETVVVTEGLDSVEIMDKAGYIDNFPGSKQNGIGRIWDTWNQTADPSSGFSASTDPTTSWSEA